MTQTESTAAGRLDGTLIASVRLVRAAGGAASPARMNTAHSAAPSAAPWAIEIETKCGRVVHLVCARAGERPPLGAERQKLQCCLGPFMPSAGRAARDLTTEAAVAFAHRPRVVALRAAPEQEHAEWRLSFDTGITLVISATAAGPRLDTRTTASGAQH